MLGRALDPAVEGRLARWLVPATIVHVAALAWAGRPDASHARAAPPGETTIEIVPELRADSAKAPDAPPAAPPRLDTAAGASPRPVPAPPVGRPSAARPGPPSRDTREPIEERLFRTLSAVAAEASKILTTTEGNGPPIATGNAASSYGMVAGDGTGTSPTFDPRAGLRGQPGGSGQPPAGDGPDQSRGASVFTGYNEDCDFPEEANRDRVDHGWATLIVTVRADGHAAAVQLLGDSGHGFGRMALQCARSARYRPARDRKGAPIQADTPSFRYRFTR
jgi:hypothetical protein